MNTAAGEILQQECDKLDNMLHQSLEKGEYGLHPIIKSMEEYAKQDAIDFAEWLSGNEWVKRTKTHPNKVGQYYSHKYCEYKTIEQLSEIYLKSKQNA